VSDDVYIIGASMTRFGRYPEVSIEDLGADAAQMALADADVAIQDIEALHCGNVMQSNAMPGQRILNLIGQTGIPVVNCSNACATGATALREGWASIRAGLHDLVLVVGVEKMSGAGLLSGASESTGIPTEGILGSDTMPVLFSLLGQEHTRKHGTTFEQFARVSEKNHFHSTLNPKSMYRKETPLETVMSAEMIAYPNTKLMCSVNVDGAAAVVLASERKAQQLGLRRAVKIRASVLTSDSYSDRNSILPDFNSCTQAAARQAFEMAHLGPGDLDLVELHDCFATAELVHYENLGLCGPGEAGKFIDQRDTYLGGRIPVNASGGLLSKGHPAGATGVANVYEVATHLRGEAGKRQVDGARIGMTHVVGVGMSCSIHVLEGPSAI